MDEDDEDRVNAENELIDAARTLQEDHGLSKQEVIEVLEGTLE